MNIQLDKAEIRRYSGYKEKFKIIPDIEKKIDELIMEVRSKARVKYVYDIFDITVSMEKTELSNTEFKSKALVKNLQNCNKAVLLAITLGNEIDMLIRRYSILDTASMVLIQAISAEYLEKYIDQIEQKIVNGFDKKIQLSTRFSPGYSDLDIAYQKDVISILEAHKKIGLSLTESYMLAPGKSVTAIIGITDKDYKKSENKCSLCDLKNCGVREN